MEMYVIAQFPISMLLKRREREWGLENSVNFLTVFRLDDLTYGVGVVMLFYGASGTGKQST